MKIAISQTGLASVRAISTAFRGRMLDLRPGFARAATFVLDAAKTQINEEGDPPWAPKKKPNGLPLLVRKGALKESLQADFGEAITEIEGGIAVGTNLPYAPAQQFGTDKAGRNHDVHIPARPFLWRDPGEYSVKIRDIFADFIAHG